MNEIEIQELRKPAAGQIILTAFVTGCTHIANEIVNEIEIQGREKPAAGEIFYNICHSRQSRVRGPPVNGRPTTRGRAAKKTTDGPPLARGLPL